MSPEDIIRQEIDALNRHDVDGILALYAEDAVVIEPASPEPIQGTDALRADADNFLRAFPDLRVEHIATVWQGNDAASEMVFSGTQKGPMDGPGGPIAPTNRRVEFRGLAFYHLDEAGRVREQRRYYNPMEFARQLGISRAQETRGDMPGAARRREVEG